MNTTANCARLWIRRTDRKTPKFDTVIVDLPLGDKCGLILDTMGLFVANRTAATFGISGNKVDAIAAVRGRTGFVFWKPISPQSICASIPDS